MANMGPTLLFRAQLSPCPSSLRLESRPGQARLGQARWPHWPTPAFCKQLQSYIKAKAMLTLNTDSYSGACQPRLTFLIKVLASRIISKLEWYADQLTDVQTAKTRR